MSGRFDTHVEHFNDAYMWFSMTTWRRVMTNPILLIGISVLAVVLQPTPTAMAAAPDSRSFSLSQVSAAPATALRGVPLLRFGDRGLLVRTLQQRLSALGYWTGPIDARFGPLTQQAVFALQKAASLSVDGVVGVATAGALARGAKPRIVTTTGNEVQINLHSQLLMIVRSGRLATILNTSTGGGYSYSSGGVTSRATTPRGVFTIFRQVNAMDVSPLGMLWRPKYFISGYAIHGSDSVPTVAVSHGCVRVSNQAMDWIWTSQQMPIGTTVRIY
ncbi:MAG: L,D-transpeptidase family protein [Acidimicrobiales bacterium]